MANTSEADPDNLDEDLPVNPQIWKDLNPDSMSVHYNKVFLLMPMTIYTRVGIRIRLKLCGYQRIGIRNSTSHTHDKNKKNRQ